jgi:hypothetical protein
MGITSCTVHSRERERTKADAILRPKQLPGVEAHPATHDVASAERVTVLHCGPPRVAHGGLLGCSAGVAEPLSGAKSP